MTPQVEPLADSVLVAAARLGICRAQIYREFSSGRLVGRKVGRRTLVERSAQSAWLSALPIMGAAEAAGA